MKLGCRLARLFGKSIMYFYARNQYILMNTQPIIVGLLFAVLYFRQFCFIGFAIFLVEIIAENIVFGC